MRPQLISQMKGTMPAAPHRSYILVTHAAPDPVTRWRKYNQIILGGCPYRMLRKAHPLYEIKNNGFNRFKN